MAKIRAGALGLAGAAGLFAVLVALRLHGFSLPVWHQVIDDSPQTECLWGTARPLRSDDYLCVLPQALAQCAARPAFPVENPLIGDGRYNMVINYAMPVRHWVTLFRPQVWGYFISPDVGLAFNWWFNAFGAWLALFLVLKRVAGADGWRAAAGATALVFSPFFQYWSLNCAPAVIFASGVMLAGRAVLQAATPRAAWAAALGLAWCGAALFLTFSFTPYVITLLYLTLFVLGGLAIARRTMAPDGAAWRWSALAAGCAAAGLVLAVVLIENRDVVALVYGSSYPGRRLAGGGAEPLPAVFRSNIFALASGPGWDTLGTVAMSAGFILFGPLVMAAALWDAVAGRRKLSPLLVALAVYWLSLLLWNVVGWPDWLARWSLLERVPERRAWLGLGLADLLLVATWVAGTRRRPSARQLLVLTLAWALFNAGVGLQLCRLWPSYPPRFALLGVAAVAALGCLILAAPRLGLGALAAISLWVSAGFNPLVQGGTDFLRDNPLSRKIVELDRAARAAGRPSVWLCYGDTYEQIGLPNLFRILGVRCLNGAHAYPQPGLWQILDPDGEAREVYNRYAQLAVGLPPAPEDIRILLIQQDWTLLQINPAHPRLAALGVDHVLYSGREAGAFAASAPLEEVFAYAGKHLYRVRRP